MDEHRHDIAARAAALTRRRSLATLGAATLAAVLVAPRQAEAGKAAKKAKKRVKKTCKRQEDQCVAFFSDLCQENECDPEGLEAALDCCGILDDCQAGDFLACMASVDLEEPEPV